MKPNIAKGLLAGVIAGMALAFIAAIWLATQSAGQVESLEAAWEEIDLKKVRSAGKLRAQMHRLSATLLRFHVTRDRGDREQFHDYSGFLTQFLEELQGQEGYGEAYTLVKQMNRAFEQYFEQAAPLLESAAGSSTGEQRLVQDIERLQGRMDAIHDLVNQLEAIHRESFRSQLRAFQKSSSSLQGKLHALLVLQAVFIALMLWSGYRALYLPLRSQLAEAKTQARQKEALASIGTLAGGIAHEIRNPLTAMKARTFALKELVKPNSHAAKQAEVIDSELNRLERIVRDFLNFARPSEPNLERIDLGNYLQEIHQSISPEMASRPVDFQLELQTAASAWIDPQQIRQVILNLVRNAAEACPDQGGRIVLRLLRTESGIRILVLDNGAGMPPEIQKNIFTPFFSRKPAGTGLGLSVSKNIVEKHQGHLGFESEPGKGSSFFIDLNAAESR